MSSAIFMEAANSILAMHEMESILSNNDIPIESRKLCLDFVSVSIRKKLTFKQQKNVESFREIFVRIDKDTRFFRTFLTVAVNIAEHFKFDNISIVYAFKNISLIDHFPNFVDFARRQNPIIDKNSPLQLLLTLGFSILKLAIQKNQNVINRDFDEEKKQSLFEQYRKLSLGMSERFIDIDFGLDIVTTQEQDASNNDLNAFNNDDSDDEESDESAIIKVDVQATIEEIPQHLRLDNDMDDIVQKYLCDPGDLTNDGGSNADGNILKTLKNGNTEIDLKSLDNLVIEANKTFGQSTLSAIGNRIGIKNSDSLTIEMIDTSVGGLLDENVNIDSGFGDGGTDILNHDYDEERRSVTFNVKENLPAVHFDNNFHLHNIVDFSH